MSEENEPKAGGDESAAAAKEAAKDFAGNASAMFKGLDQKMQIYLIALAVTAVCALFFSAYKVSVKSKATGTGADAMISSMAKSAATSPALIGLDGGKGSFGGKLAFLGAAAGIGILLWSIIAKRKDPWIPLGLAGAAGIAVLGILITRMGTGSGPSNDFVKVSVNGTLLGWWLPFIAAAAATAVSVMRITNAK